MSHSLLVLPTRKTSLSSLERAIDSLFADFKIDPSVYGHVKVSLTEAVTNAIHHGNRGDVHKNVTVEFILEEDLLKVRVQDEGEGFDPDSLPDPTAPGTILCEGGRGVFLMRRLSDDIQFLNEGRLVEMSFGVRTSMEAEQLGHAQAKA